MENQFILRLPSTMTNVDLNEATLQKINNNTVVFKYKNKEYRGFIYRPPTVIESHKVIDGKIYKISDIQSIIRIVTDDEINRIEDYETLTPPMKYCKERRFKKEECRLELVEEVEKEVRRLLEEDSKAVKVEIVEQMDEEIDEIAADLEMELDELEMTEESNQTERVERKDQEIEKQIKEKEDLIEKTTNPILKKRFTEELRILKEKQKEGANK